MTTVQGGNFWTGFAAGSLASVASSLYQGGQSTMVNSAGERVGIAGTGLNSIGDNLGGAGMIAFGTIAGGAGAALTGGNFWQGAVTGLVVSGLNHYLHSGKTVLSEAEPEGEIYNWFQEDDGALYDYAQHDNVKVKGVIKIYAHATETGIEGPDGRFITSTKKLSSILMKISPAWKNHIKNGGKLTLVLKACSSGANIKNGFAKRMSCDFNQLNVIAPTKNYAVVGWTGWNTEWGVMWWGKWNLFYNGTLIKSFNNP
jgi:hypothetical protein